MHSLVRLFAREQAHEYLDGADRESVLDRALGAWLSLAEQADALVPHGCYGRPAGPTVRRPQDPEAAAHLLRDPLAWLDTERHTLTALLLQAAGTGRAAAAWELAAALLPYYEIRALCTDWQATHLRTLDCVRAAGDRLGTAMILLGLGELHTLRDQVPEAVNCFSRAREIFADLGEAHGVVDCDNGLGHILRVSGRYDEALVALASAAKAAEHGGWPRSEAYARHCASVVHLERGALDTAEAGFRCALAIAEGAGYLRGVAQSERGLGLLHAARGDLQQAEAHLERALALSTELGEPGGRGYAMQSLADVRMRLGRHDTVGDLLHASLRIFETTGEPFGQALVLSTLGEHQRRTGQAAQAAATAAESVRIWARLNTPRGHARALVVLGDAHAAGHDRPAARHAWQQARGLFESLGLPEAAALALRLAADEDDGPPRPGTGQ
jgi:tetratricopeptide (TPR) repeat protein